MSTLVLLLAGCRSNTCVGLGEQETDVERMATSWGWGEGTARTEEEYAELWASMDTGAPPEVDLTDHQVVAITLREGSCSSDQDDVVVGFYAGREAGQLVAKIERPTCGTDFCADSGHFTEIWHTPIAAFSTCQRDVPCPERADEVFPW